MRIEFDTARKASWAAAIAVAFVLFGGAGWLIAGSGPPVYTDAVTKAAQPAQLANGTPGAGKYPRGGACPTGTSIDTSTGTTDRQCWSKIQASDVEGLPIVSGTQNYVAKFGASGLTNSSMREVGGGYMSLAKNFAIQNADLATALIENASDSGLYPRIFMVRQRGTIETPLAIRAGDYLGLINFTARTSGGYGYSGAYLYAIADAVSAGGNITGRACLKLANGTSADANITSWCSYPTYFDIAGGLKIEALDGGGVGKYLYQSGTDGTISAKTIAASDVGAEPTLPACPPGQLPMYTGTGTGTSTAKTCSTVVSDTYKVKAYSSSEEQFLNAAIVSTDSSINLAQNGTGTAAKVNITAAFGTSTPVSVAGTTGAVGTSPTVSRSDHAHACLTANASQNGCMSSADKMKLDGLSADDHKVSAFDGSNYGYLYDVLFSSLGTISVGVNSSQSPTRISLNANTGSTSGTVCAGDDSRLSNARTPTAHGSTHNPGGSDVPSAFTNTPGVGKVATLTSAGQNLDSWTTASATPGASRIVKTGTGGNVNGWLSLSADPFTNTPGVGKVATLTSAGQNLNGWILGKTQVNHEELTSGSDYFTTASSGWFFGPTRTFTSGGDRFVVTVQATIATVASPATFCALTVVADTGSSARTQRGKETFTILAGSSNGFTNSTTFYGYTVYSSSINIAEFDLATGQVTVGSAMYQDSSIPCRVPSGYLKLYVDVYK